MRIVSLDFSSCLYLLVSRSRNHVTSTHFFSLSLSLFLLRFFLFSSLFGLKKKKSTMSQFPKKKTPKKNIYIKEKVLYTN